MSESNASASEGDRAPRKPWFWRMRRTVRNVTGWRYWGGAAGNVWAQRTSLFEQIERAIMRPPRWENIEALERAWGIDETNRRRVIRNLMVEVALHLILVGIGVWQVFRWLDGAPFWFSLFPGGLVLMLGLAKGLIAAWRADVLSRRHPMNFMQWLIGRGA